MRGIRLLRIELPGKPRALEFGDLSGEFPERVGLMTGVSRFASSTINKDNG
jgi:hypothetical protein